MRSLGKSQSLRDLGVALVGLAIGATAIGALAIGAVAASPFEEPASMSSPSAN